MNLRVLIHEAIPRNRSSPSRFRRHIEFPHVHTQSTVFVRCLFRPRSTKKLKMVTIINGEIVQDNDPRAQEFRNRGRRQEQQQRQPQQQWSHSQNPPHEQQGGSIFDQLNNRLISAGFPRWNLGQNVVEPIVSVALILALVLFGIQGVLLVGVVWFIMQQSRQR